MKTRTRTSTVAFAVLLTVALVGPRSATAAILTVTGCADSGPTTLRGLVSTASTGNTILLPACTITLATGVDFEKSLILLGRGAARMIVSGGRVTPLLSYRCSQPRRRHHFRCHGPGGRRSRLGLASLIPAR